MKDNGFHGWLKKNAWALIMAAIGNTAWTIINT